MSTGSWFHSLRATTENDLSPNLITYSGKIHLLFFSLISGLRGSLLSIREVQWNLYYQTLLGGVTIRSDNRKVG